MHAEVMDTIELKGRVAIEHGEQGVVVIFAQPPGMPEPRPGDPIMIVRPDGWMFRSVIREAKEHGPDGRSVFMRGLTKSDVPIGAHLYWGDALRRHLEVASREVSVS
jgi:hypothetical protein